MLSLTSPNSPNSGVDNDFMIFRVSSQISSLLTQVFILLTLLFVTNTIQLMDVIPISCGRTDI